MPKRKRSKDEHKQHLNNKMKRLEKQLQKLESDVSSSTESDLEEVLPLDFGTVTPSLQPSDWILEVPVEDPVDPVPGPSISEPLPQPENSSKEGSCVLDSDALEILGEDPSSTVKHGPEVLDELAKRLTYIAMEGLTRDVRKELVSKFLTPGNCVQLNAPSINAEIKAAVNEASLKRDKGIEAKQKQLSSAISGLCQLINTQIVSKDKDKESLQQLMDVAKILCDLQQADSVTRRNFILFNLKNEIKDHLKSTKISTYLFGNELAETLKTAKAVNKSGAEIKISEAKNPPKRSTKPLNRRAPPQPRRPQGQAPTQQFVPRSWKPAAPRAPPPPPGQPAYSSRVSSQQNRPSAPQPYQRRRY